MSDVCVGWADATGAYCLPAIRKPGMMGWNPCGTLPETVFCPVSGAGQLTAVPGIPDKPARLTDIRAMPR